MNHNPFTKIIAIILLLNFLIPAEVLAAFDKADVLFNFTNYNGEETWNTDYEVFCELFDEDSKSAGTFFNWYDPPQRRFSSLKSFSNYKLKCTLMPWDMYGDGTEQPQFPEITRNIKTRVGYQIKTVKIPNTIFVEWAWKIQEYINGEKKDTDYFGEVELYDPETNKLRQKFSFGGGHSNGSYSGGAENVLPGLYNVVVKPFDGQDTFEVKRLNKFPIFKNKTTVFTVTSKSSSSPVTFIFRKPLKHDAKVSMQNKSWVVEKVIPAASETYSFGVPPGLYNVQVEFRTGDVLKGPLGFYENEYRISALKPRVITLYEMDYSKFSTPADNEAPVEICSSDAGSKNIILKDPVYDLELARAYLSGTGCIVPTRAGSSGESAEVHYKHPKNKRIKVVIENTTTGTIEERVVYFKGDQQLQFGSEQTAASSNVTFIVKDINTKQDIPQWKAKIRRLSDSEFIGTKVNLESGETETLADQEHATVTFPYSQSKYELSVDSEGYTTSVKQIKVYKDKTMEVLLSKASQMKDVTINLTTFTDNKNVIIDDIQIFAHYYKPELQGEGIAGVRDTELIGDAIPIQGVQTKENDRWVFTIQLPENKTFYLQPVVYFKASNTTFTYIFKTQKHKITPLTDGTKQTIDIPINILGSETKLVVLEKHGSTEKERVDNIAVSVNQVYQNSEKATGIKEFALDIDSLAPDQSIWLPDGIFVQATIQTPQRDLYKYIKNQTTSNYEYTSNALRSKTYKTPLQYDESKYSGPAMVLSYQRNYEHPFNVKIKVNIDVNTPGTDSVDYDLRKAILKVTGTNGYKDSMNLPTSSTADTLVEWIAGFPQAGEYTFELKIPYKVTDGEKQLLNSKGEIWKTVPVYKKLEWTKAHTIDLSTSGGGAAISFDVKLEDSGDKLLTTKEDKSKKAVFKPVDSSCINFGDDGSSTSYWACGSHWADPGCTINTPVLLTDFQARPKEDGGASPDVPTFKLKKEDGSVKWHSVNSIRLHNSAFSPDPDNPDAGIIDIIAEVKCGGCPSAFMSGDPDQDAECTYPHIRFYNSDSFTIMPINWYGGGPGGFRVGDGNMITPPGLSHSEKKITVRIRNSDPNQMFPLSQQFIDPSRRVPLPNGDDTPARTYKNTFVTFNEIRPDGLFGQKWEKTWISKTIATQYEKTWIIPAYPDRKVSVCVQIPDRTGGTSGKVICDTADKGQSATVDITYEKDFGDVSLSPGTRYPCSSFWVEKDQGASGGLTIKARVNAVNEWFKLSGITCEDNNKECWAATKTIIDKFINNTGSTWHAEIELTSNERDIWGALPAKLYVEGEDIEEILRQNGVQIKVISEKDLTYVADKTVKLIVKAFAGGNKTFSGKKVFVTVNPQYLPTMRKITQGTTSDALAYWGGITHTLEVDPSDPSRTLETTININSKGGENVKLFFYTSDTESFFQKTWLSQLLKDKTDNISHAFDNFWYSYLPYDDFDKFSLEKGQEEVEKSARLKAGDFSYAVKNITVTLANYQYVNTTIPAIGAASYTDYKTINVVLNATSNKGFRANLIDLTAAGTAIEAARIMEMNNKTMRTFNDLALSQKDIYNRASTPGSAGVVRNARYEASGPVSSRIFKDIKTGKTYSASEFASLAAKNFSLTSAYRKLVGSKGLALLKALTLQPFTKVLQKAFTAVPYADSAMKFGILAGMGLPLSGMPLVRVQTTMDSKNIVMEATDASTSFQAIDWVRNWFNKPLMARTITVPVKTRKGKSIYVSALASGHEPFKQLVTVSEEIWNSGQLNVNISLNENVTYSYANLEAFFQNYPLFSERIEEFALAPEMFATTSERQELVEYMKSGFETLLDSLIKDFTPFASAPSGSDPCEQDPMAYLCPQFCELNPWTPACPQYDSWCQANPDACNGGR